MSADEPRYNQAEVQAFIDQAKWLLGHHDKRSETLGQRATTLLGFISATTALLPAAFTFGREAIRFTVPVRVNVVLVLLALVGAASCCLWAVAVRKATVPSNAKLREQWARYGTGGGRGLVHGQIANSLIGGEPADDPVATSAAEAARRAAALRGALGCVGAAVLLMAGLTTQILAQQV